MPQKLGHDLRRTLRLFQQERVPSARNKCDLSLGNSHFENISKRRGSQFVFTAPHKERRRLNAKQPVLQARIIEVRRFPAQARADDLRFVKSI